MKRIRNFCLAIAVFALASGNPIAALAQTNNRNAASAPLVAPRLDFEKYKLKNGLEVILVEDHRLPLVATNLWYHVGPANERPGLTGFAHLFEHMMFQGSKHVGDDAHFKLLEGAGANDINGTTDFDRTNYFETLPSNQLELSLWLESDRMGFLLDTLDGAKLANQRDVVRNERRQGENSPYGLVEEAVYHQLFPKSHPYYASVIGSHADIESARLKDVREFFKTYYAPNNASLAIVGDINKAQAKALVEKYFGAIPAGPPVPKLNVSTPSITSERREVVTDQVELPRVYMAWLTDPVYKPGDAEADLLAMILGGGKSSRLYKRLVYERQIAQDVGVSQNSLILGSVFQIQATAKPGVKPEDLEKAINEELDAVRKDGVRSEEISRARNVIQTRIVQGLETLGGFGGVADRLNQYNHYLGDPSFLAKDLERYDKATAAAVQKVAQEKLTNNARVVVYGVPGKKVVDDVPKTTEAEASASAAATPASGNGAQQADDAWRNQVPQAGAASKLALPVPKSFKLANGLTVLLAEKHNLPVVAANLVVLSGSEANPADKPGLASFTADMLDEGTAKRSTLQIAEDVAAIGATLGTGSSSDASTVSVRTLKKNADTALEILADVALQPAFAAKELDRVRNTRLTQVLQQRDNPNVLASKVFNSEVYGTSHPYGYTELGTEDSIKAVTREDMSKFWQAGYVPENAALVVAGDLSESELRALAEKHFGKWAGKAGTVTRPEVRAASARRILLVDKPGAPQTALRIGMVGVPRANPDYVPIEVMNTGLGGLFSSRINMNLREKNGYTYGAGSTFQFRRGPGPFFTATSVRTDVTAPAVREIFNEFERMRASDVSAEELKIAKDSFARSLPGLFETTGQAAATIGQIFIYSLPLDYYSTLPGKIDAVTVADVRRVAEKYLLPDSMVIVAVGDRSKIEPELLKLNLGKVEARGADGKATTTPDK
ncbi:MAG TPA: pitrilysin family protein [Pyrinomonadaceae bacterium]|jgi:zinc protease|nr:pitrilysin family protein [Pyrinomonadaceae bacterium]